MLKNNQMFAEINICYLPVGGGGGGGAVLEKCLPKAGGFSKIKSSPA